MEKEKSCIENLKQIDTQLNKINMQRKQFVDALKNRAELWVSPNEEKSKIVDITIENDFIYIHYDYTDGDFGIRDTSSMDIRIDDFLECDTLEKATERFWERFQERNEEMQERNKEDEAELISQFQKKHNIT